MAERRTVRPWVWALGALVAVLLLAFALVVGPWLLTRYPQKGLTSEQSLKAKNDVRTTLVQALAGLAVAGGLAVTYSTYRQNQRDQAARREEQDRAHQLSVARHVNDLYTKAVEQLGHDQAPVRLGALYSLVHLAQANPEQRQTVVDVLCAYLRMPYSLPDPPTPSMRQEYAEQLQVRLTVQRLLADHLRVPDGVSSDDVQKLLPSPGEPFWPGISLNLAGATLIGFDFRRASVIRATFDRATFAEYTYFNSATFNSGASFREATFLDVTWFGEATLADKADFREATFTREVKFVGTVFTGSAWFNEVTFKHDARFPFSTFGDSATFYEANFIGGAWFDDVNFGGIAFFKKTIFSGGASFGGANASGADFPGARVLPFDDEYLNSDRDVMRVWPRGWTVRPDADDPTRGTLVRDEQAGPSGRATPSGSTAA
ncbi:pentapeptide repeat-containing protein [Micromonospora coxensis]|uniref:pentapeptide repeat-containing protein n=1 Tax=Micromonospora coxensis TaxID=356852 RepID=UPI003420DF94